MLDSTCPELIFFKGHSTVRQETLISGAILPRTMHGHGRISAGGCSSLPFSSLFFLISGT